MFTLDKDWEGTKLNTLHDMLAFTCILPLIVESTVDIFRYLNHGRSIIRSDIEVVIRWIVGNSISLPTWVPDQGARINSVGEQLLSCPPGTFILGDVDRWSSGMRKYDLQLSYTVIHLGGNKAPDTALMLRLSDVDIRLCILPPLRCTKHIVVRARSVSMKLLCFSFLMH